MAVATGANRYPYDDSLVPAKHAIVANKTARSLQSSEVFHTTISVETKLHFRQKEITETRYLSVSYLLRASVR